MKDLEFCFGVSAPTTFSALNPAVPSTLQRYGLSLTRLRYDYKNGVNK